MKSIFKLLEVGNERIVDSIIYVQDKPIGILLPSTFIGFSESGKYTVCGPNGIKAINDPKNKKEIFEALIQVKSILFGTADESVKVATLLKENATSRTMSYYCCIGENCSQVITAHSKITNSRILIIGCGGIGSLVAMQLAGANVKSLTLVDPDRIEESNLNRQLFWTKKDINHFKVDILKDRLVDRYDVECNIQRVAITEDNLDKLTEDIDAVVLSADQPIGIGQTTLSKLSAQKNFLYLSTGYSHHQAIVRVQGGRKITAPEKVYEHIQWERTPNFIGPSFGPMNVEISGVTASILLHQLGFNIDNSELRQKEEVVWYPLNHLQGK